jgi:hypothetical protein
MEHIETTLAPVLQHSQISSASKAAVASKKIKIATLISQTRLMRGLPLLAGGDLALAVSSWERVLRDVPESDLDAAFDRAIEEAPLGEPFGAPHVRLAYVHIAEERGRDRRAEAWRNPGTFRCWLCQDEGFQQVLIYCPAWHDWFGKMRQCGCEAQHINQRLPPVEPPDWQRNDRGIWEPVGHAGLKCGCLACQRKRD